MTGNCWFRDVCPGKSVRRGKKLIYHSLNTHLSLTFSALRNVSGWKTEFISFPNLSVAVSSHPIISSVVMWQERLVTLTNHLQWKLWALILFIVVFPLRLPFNAFLISFEWFKSITNKHAVRSLMHEKGFFVPPFLFKERINYAWRVTRTGTFEKWFLMQECLVECSRDCSCSCSCLVLLSTSQDTLNK